MLLLLLLSGGTVAELKTVWGNRTGLGTEMGTGSGKGQDLDNVVDRDRIRTGGMLELYK